MVKSADEFDASNLLHEHARQVERLCRRRYGRIVWSKAEILEVLRDLMLQRIQRFARTIAQLGDQAGEAAHQVEVLNRVIVAARKPPAKGRKRRAPRS